MANYYGLDDGDGNQITTGLSPHNAREVAQRMADDRGKTLYLYEDGLSDEDAETQESEAIEPSTLAVTISDSGNGFPAPGAYVEGDGTLYEVVSCSTHIQTAAGRPNWIAAVVREADYEDCAADDVFAASIYTEVR